MVLYLYPSFLKQEDLPFLEPYQVAFLFHVLLEVLHDQQPPLDHLQGLNLFPYY
jgi:hypothetical protein